MAGESAVQYYVNQSNAIAGGVALVGSPNYTTYGLEYVGYPDGAVPPEATALIAAGYEPGTIDFNQRLIAALQANLRPVATATDLAAATTYVPTPPPPPVIGPTRYLVNGTFYDNEADAVAAEAVKPTGGDPAATATAPVTQTGTPLPPTLFDPRIGIIDPAPMPIPPLTAAAPSSSSGLSLGWIAALAAVGVVLFEKSQHG